jgi:Fe-Mn family superoxide dismutase
MQLPYYELPGLSKKLIADHFKLYEGYIKRLNKIHRTLEDLPKKVDRFEYQRLLSEEGFLRNAVVLHELYFQQLTPGGHGDPRRIFGQQDVTDQLLDRLALAALGSTGWAVVGRDGWRGNDFIFTMKEHGQGFVAGAWPLLVLDAYEHAYMPEYGLEKGDYIAAFFSNVDWLTVEGRAVTARVAASHDL